MPAKNEGKGFPNNSITIFLRLKGKTYAKGFKFDLRKKPLTNQLGAFILMEALLKKRKELTKIKRKRKLK